jgi:catechol 2,3-dioxygenase-like lactoylglutathione lyase family enzyme
MTHEHDHEHDHDHHHDVGPRHFFATTPVLLVDDVKAAAEYYRDVLGFELAFETPTYASVFRDEASMHFNQSNPPGGRNSAASAGARGVDVYIGVTDVDALYEELKGRGAKTLSEPTTWPYGMREFVFEDLYGYRIILGEAVAGA